MAVAIFSVISRNSACLGLLYTMSKLRVLIGGIHIRRKLSNILCYCKLSSFFKVCSRRIFISLCINHGYQNLSGQYLRTRMLSCVYQQVHQSKTASLLAHFLPSLSTKNSSNQRNSRHHFMSRVSSKLHHPWKR